MTSTNLLGDLMQNKTSGPKKTNRDKSPKRTNHDKSPKREKSKKSSKKDKKKSKKKEKKPSVAKSFTKRFMPLDGDREYTVEVIFEGTGCAPPSGDLKSGEISRVLLVAKNGLGNHPMLAVKNDEEKRWEFLTKENQTKLIQRQEFKTHSGQAITRPMIGAWLNRWPICDVETTNEKDAEISDALKNYPIVSDNYAASMTQFNSKGIKFADLGQRVAWSAVCNKNEEYPRPGHFYPEKENTDPSSSSAEESDSSSEEPVDNPVPTDGSIAEPEKPKPIRDTRKPLRGVGQSHMNDFGNGLKSLRTITASGELAAKTIAEGSIRPTISMSRPLPPKPDQKAEPTAKPDKKRKAEPEKKRKQPEKTDVTKPAKAARVSALSLANSHWTARKLLQGHAALERSGNLEKYMDNVLLTSLMSTKKTLEEFINLPGDDFIRKVALNLLLELRFLEKNKPGFASTSDPMASFIEALGLLHAELGATKKSIIEVAKEKIKAIDQLADFSKQEYVVPRTEPATLIEHFQNGVLDNVTELWLHTFMNPQTSLVQHDIGAKSEEERTVHSKAMHAHRNQMLTLVSAWKGTSVAESDDDSFDPFSEH